MRKVFVVLRTIMGISTAIAAIALILLSVFLRSTIPVVANPDLFKEGFRSGGFYQTLSPVALPIIVDATIEEPLPVNLADISENLSAEDWRAIANNLIPPEWLQTQIEQAIDSIFLWLDGQTARIEYQVDTVELVSRLRGEQGQQAISRILAMSAPCTANQTRALRAIETQNSASAVPVCRPTEEDEALMRERLNETVAILANTLEQQPQVSQGIRNILRNQLTPEPRTDDNPLIEIPLTYQVIKVILQERFLLLLPLPLIALTMIFVVRSLKGFGQWIGAIAFASGVLLLIFITVFSINTANNLTQRVLTTNQSDVEASILLERLGAATLNIAYTPISQSVLAHALGLFIIGTVLFLITWITPGPSAIMDSNAPSNVDGVSSTHTDIQRHQ